MKKIALLFIVVMGTLTQGKCNKCDTIDMYWVYYNDTVWVKLNQDMYGYLLKLDTIQIKKHDSISIEYNTDTPCEDCWNTIQVEDKEHILLKENRSKGTGTKISFSLQELMQLSNKNQIKNLYFYYNHRPNELLIQLKLE